MTPSDRARRSARCSTAPTARRSSALPPGVSYDIAGRHRQRVHLATKLPSRQRGRHTCRSQGNVPVVCDFGVLTRDQTLEALGILRIPLAARRSGRPDRTSTSWVTPRLTHDNSTRRCPVRGGEAGKCEIARPAQWRRRPWGGSGQSAPAFSQSAARRLTVPAGLRCARRSDPVRERQRNCPTRHVRER